MKRHFNFEEFEGAFKRYRPSTSPRKAEAADKFSSDVETLQKRHPSVNVDVISTILETHENNASDASASLKLFESSEKPDQASVNFASSAQDDLLAEIPSLADRLSTAIRTAETEEKAVHVAQTFLKSVASTVTAAESKAQRNLAAAKSLVSSLHQNHERSAQTEAALREELVHAEERAASAERAAELLRWHLDQSSRSYYPFGGSGPSAGGVF